MQQPITKYVPYTLSDVHASASRKLFTAVSFFAGCGGSSTGYKLAGGDVRLVSEFIPAAQETYLANYPGTPMLTKDIRDTTVDEVLTAIGMKKGELDLMDGSFPCSSFSHAGKREKLWGQVKRYSTTQQRTDDLYLEYVRVLNGLLPKVCVSENVKGLTHGKSKDIRDEILRLVGENYDVDYRVLSSKNFGVPQNRERFIMVGVRKDLKMSPVFPESHGTYIPVRHAFDGMQQDEVQRVWLIEQGKKYKNMQLIVDIPNPGDRHPIRFNQQRNWLDRPSKTLMACDGNIGSAGLLHPTEPRRHTIAEAKRLMGFPEDFQLTGNFTLQYERLGRAVPPLLMKAVAETVYKNILSK